MADVLSVCAGMMSADMQQEQGRQNWEEQTQRRYEFEQLAEADREQRVEVSFACMLRPTGCVCIPCHSAYCCTFLIDFENVLDR